MVNVLLVIGIVIIVLGLGAGSSYLIWVFTRSKKETWKANVYQVGEGVKPLIKDKRGNIISSIELSDLRPFARDVIEKVERAPGITVYNLVKLKRVVPAVVGDSVEYWGEKQKEVDVIIDKDTPTIMTKGYDKKTARTIFTPIPHDRVQMIKGEIALRKERLSKPKDVLLAALPYIVIGVALISLVMVAYIMINGMIEISENLKETYRQVGKAPEPEPLPEVKEEEPPLIEGG